MNICPIVLREPSLLCNLRVPIDRPHLDISTILGVSCMWELGVNSTYMKKNGSLPHYLDRECVMQQLNTCTRYSTTQYMHAYAYACMRSSSRTGAGFPAGNGRAVAVRFRVVVGRDRLRGEDAPSLPAVQAGVQGEDARLDISVGVLGLWKMS